eukprot:gene42843-53159_t
MLLLVEILMPLSRSSTTSAGFSNAAAGGDSDATQQIINNVANTLNALNCDGASVVICSGKNRNPCDSIAKTCGTCMTGYIGVSGDSNAKCFPEGYIAPTAGPSVSPSRAPSATPSVAPSVAPSVEPRRKLTVTAGDGTVGALCNENDDCIYNQCDSSSN